ncbi:hypothetical protein [Parabacteroides pacaensis]|uniref:hypothetical protein n=1 Tax=Parabacteroides pacaensis TaxID=2086575 RepID=UPI000D112D51|nr:hypothetical protein [Parabacteroides pacaensis]
MKARYNKSDIMKQAWANFRKGTHKTFSKCLQAAWKTAKVFQQKQNDFMAKLQAEMAKIEASFKCTPTVYHVYEGEPYADYESNKYMGD